MSYHLKKKKKTHTYIYTYQTYNYVFSHFKICYLKHGILRSICFNVKYFTCKIFYCKTFASVVTLKIANINKPPPATTNPCKNIPTIIPFHQPPSSTQITKSHQNLHQPFKNNHQNHHQEFKKLPPIHEQRI